MWWNSSSIQTYQYMWYVQDGEGCSNTLHRNYLFPISNNLEQEACENTVGGGGSNEPIPVPHVEDVLLVNWPTESQQQDMPMSLSK